MIISKPRYGGHTNYLVSFDLENRISIEMLRKAKYILNTVVKWEHYRKAHLHILTCRNCFRMGHGTSTCNLNPRCMICAEGHRTNDCSLIIKKRSLKLDSIDNIYLKCCNCGGKHTATSDACPVRIQYISRRTDKPPVQPPSTSLSPAPPPKVNYWDIAKFPSIVKQTREVKFKKPMVIRTRSLSPTRNKPASENSKGPFNNQLRRPTKPAKQASHSSKHQSHAAAVSPRKPK